MLRTAREAKGLSLEALANQLCMGVDQLKALEEAAINRLPEMVFVVAQIRRVATFLGLDADPLIKQLKQTELESKPATPMAASRPSPPTANSRRTSANGTASTSSALGWMLKGLGALVVLASLAALAWRQQQALPAGGQSAGAAGSTPAQPLLSPPNRASAAIGATKADLVLSSREGSWISVLNGSGQRLYQGLLKGERRFPADRGLKVLAGRPDLVRVRSGSSPSRRLGAINDVIWRPLR